MSKEKLSQHTKQGLNPIIQKLLINRILFLVNNQRKVITLLLVLFFSFLAQSDLNNLLLDIPNFNKLIVSEGKIKIIKGQERVHDDFTLVTSNQVI